MKENIEKSSHSNDGDSLVDVLLGQSSNENFQTKVNEEIYSIEYLKALLKIKFDIDFALEYYKGEEEENDLLGLRAELKTVRNLDRRKMIENQLESFEPKTDVKISIIIEKLMQKAQEHGYDLGCINNQPCVFSGSYWVFLKEEIMKSFLAMIGEKCGIKHFEAVSAKFKDDMYKQFISESVIPQCSSGNNTVKINLLNGTFVCENGKYELKPFCCKDLLTYQLPFEYIPNAQAPIFFKYLNKVVPEKESQMVLSEYVGYIFAKHLKLEKCLVLVGTGANGKSVFGDILCALLGKSNYSSYRLKELCDKSGYYRAEIANVLLCYSSEMGSKDYDTEVAKQLFSNEPISARPPYGRPLTITNYCRFLFNVNLLPKDMEHSYAYFRRFMFLVFDVTIPEEERIPDLAEQIIANELPGVFNWALEGLDRLLIQKRFTRSKHIDNALVKVKRESNSVSLFLDENCYTPSTEDYVVSTSLYQMYDEYCKKSGFHRVNKTEFLRRIANENIHVKRKATDGATWIYCTNKISKEVDLVGKILNLN